MQNIWYCTKFVTHAPLTFLKGVPPPAPATSMVETLEKESLASPGLLMRACDPLEPARISVLPEGAGSAVAGARVAMGRPGEI